MTQIDVRSSHRCFGGEMVFATHKSRSTGTDMMFSVFVPPKAKDGPVPVLTFLAGLTCTDETFMIKAGAQRVAADLGLMLVAPDTSPRGDAVPDDPEGAYDLGLGAGFYLDAIKEPWATHYRMESYIIRDLPKVIAANFPADSTRQGLFGHSMGGHGALTLGLKHPDIYKSLSAFAPISAPSHCPWGEKAFSTYLGEDRSLWAAHDAASLMAGIRDAGKRPEILVDQGLADNFLKEQLHPHLLEEAAGKSDYPLTVRRHDGYDHGYYFISSFMEDHLRHHKKHLGS